MTAGNSFEEGNYFLLGTIFKHTMVYFRVNVIRDLGDIPNVRPRYFLEVSYGLFFVFLMGILSMLLLSGIRANADPYTNKLRTRVPLWARRCQSILCAMDRPHPGVTAVLITVNPVPGKYVYVLFYRSLVLVIKLSHWARLF